MSGTVPLLVQSAPGASSTGHSSGSVSFSTPSAAGDTIVLFVRFGGATIVNVTDNQTGGSNTYTSVLGPTQWGVAPEPTDRLAQVLVAKNITGGSKLTITVTLSGSSTHDTYIAALEYSGVDASNPVNAAAVGTGTVSANGAPTTGNLTTTVANTKLVATSWDSNESYTPTGNGSGYTTDTAAGINSISGGSGWANLTEDRTAAITGTWNATASSSPAVDQWVIQLVALRPAGSAVPVITSITPASGPIGTSVTLTGTGFTGASGVSFNGTRATTFTVSSDTQMSATVPAGATTGKISVTNTAGTGTSAGNFTVTTVPVISPITLTGKFTEADSGTTSVSSQTVSNTGFAIATGD
ncbi:MAG TPA: IPT/TIG domain-containing protein, partial [Methylomirabilota bacterium]|nr:IPT/TIG domain-containing protein [Methylomirabilota bacterium]